MATRRECLSLVIELEDSPTQPIETFIRKRCLEASSCSIPNPKRHRTCSGKGYKSPLIHLESKRPGSKGSTNLDDSIVIIEDRIGCQKSANRSLFSNKKHQSAFPDKSVIILSDDEEETRTRADSELAVIQAIRKDDISEIQTNTPTLLRKRKAARVRKRAKRVISPTNTCPTPTHRSKSNPIESQPIALDSEDENTIPNDDSFKLNSTAGTMGTEYSTRIGESGHAFTSIPRADIDIADKNTRTREKSDRPVTTGGHVPLEASSVASGSLMLPSRVILSVPLCSKIRKGSPVHTEGNATNPGTQLRSLKKSKNSSCNTTSQKSMAKMKSNVSSAADDPIVPVDNTYQDGIGSYYSNEVINKEPGSLRDIVVDGSNIAMAYTNGNSFSVDGLKLVIDYFKLRGHTVKVFIPQHRRSFKFPLLEKLHTQGIVVFTPSRKIGGKTISSYDDRFILDYATMCDGIVVSLDQYRDLYQEKHKWRHTIENRLLMPTFVGKCVMFPEDPLGKSGPKLDEFLRH